MKLILTWSDLSNILDLDSLDSHVLSLGKIEEMVWTGLDVSDINIRDSDVVCGLKAHEFAGLRRHVWKENVLNQKISWGCHSKHSIIRANTNYKYLW